MFAIICVYNNKQILNEFLLKSLTTQTSEYELQLIDNSKQQFISAAQALNLGASQVNGDYLIFIHQDIDLKNRDWLKSANQLLEKTPNIGIVGVAGATDQSGIFTNILHGTPPEYAGKNRINNVMEVQTIDECLIIIPKKIFNLLQFDEITCDDWHLYAVDYCLTIKKLGYEVYILPLSLEHRSCAFSFSESYYATLRKIFKKHKNNYPSISTTMGRWYTHVPLFVQKNVFKFLKQIYEKKRKF